MANTAVMFSPSSPSAAPLGSSGALAAASSLLSSMRELELRRVEDRLQREEQADALRASLRDMTLQVAEAQATSALAGSSGTEVLSRPVQQGHSSFPAQRAPDVASDELLAEMLDAEFRHESQAGRVFAQLAELDATLLRSMRDRESQALPPDNAWQATANAADNVRSDVMANIREDALRQRPAAVLEEVPLHSQDFLSGPTPSSLLASVRQQELDQLQQEIDNLALLQASLVSDTPTRLDSEFEPAEGLAPFAWRNFAREVLCGRFHASTASTSRV
eukprot:TRINITY_DN7400_c0_g1_i1.p1 TRINITY_DN7400_c0_g1~~TRINITY_DN7400_c0_g1_i1.p1  ORF type:complete len:277 (+),score=47.34 TRINITY_DN7400_c0_g1_i1:72-902(+)